MADLKKYIRRAPAKSGHSRVSMNKLKVLITVVSRSKADFYMDHIQSFGVNMQMVVYGQGTAPKEIATAMGLTDSDRAVIFSIIGDENLTAALDSLEEKFNTIVGGKGIAYTIPMASIIGKSIFNFLSDNRDAVRRNEQ
ncbi:hypothetical protein SAMN05720766_13013 [Fibrobacter sp. UWH9]|uniref:hypothetical protein n=1 Tax=unclassified Fibrobacter TaxID=2634177 RepID=UPI00091BA737|nr:MULTISPECIES: hypothetical protein [Fibrobacter]MCQ2099800.1 hypothetical protein [Fibrobacter sp.]MCL4101987.1 hypothetical protein [Fibrobacter succinogenes]OWV05577.1 hypothetical protein B7993_08235 [Fibrobacter sp. UWH3]OWV16538.1 hypothetical protein B7992_02140 [Fibrobacter sp. UWH1]SHH85665.1 hypothetical protein SAMN05720766_13013 [Fibrobacter sp. UWH9]